MPNEQFISRALVGPEAASRFQPNTGYDSRDNWAQISKLAKAMLGMIGGNQLNADNLSVLKSGGFLCLGSAHPFKIYNVPSILIPANNPATDWLTFRVRNGLYLNQPVAGTDNVTNPDDDSAPISPDPSDIAVPAGVAQYFFWIDASAAPAIKSGAVASAFDATHVQIGYIDTTPNNNTGPAVIRQIQRTDVTSSTGDGGSYLGEYNPALAYASGSIVKVSSGANQGIFALPPGKSAIVGQSPVFPPVPTNPWDCIGLPFQQVGACSNGQVNIIAQTTAPF